MAQNEIRVRVLGYVEDGEWVAHALEMDLMGYGSSPQESLDQLLELMTTQWKLAKEKGQPELLFHNADDKFFRMFRRTELAKIKAEFNRRAYKGRTLVRDIQIPSGLRQEVCAENYAS